MSDQSGTGLLAGLGSARSSSSSTQRDSNSVLLFHDCHSSSNRITGDINHVAQLSADIGSLFLNDNYTDVTLVLGDGTQLRSHKVLLASRSEYFRALLYGGMKESSQATVDLRDITGVSAFKSLLHYIYTGRISLCSLKEEGVLEIFGLAHKYGFVKLESAVSDYLRDIISVDSLCTIFGAAHLYSLSTLVSYCLDYADLHASDIIKTEGFLHLSHESVTQLVSRDSFCAPEIDIFRALLAWVEHHNEFDSQIAASSSNQELKDEVLLPTGSLASQLLTHIRLHLISLEDLLNVVRPSGLITSDAILDAIREQTEKRDMELSYRGFLMTGVNVATPGHGAQVIEGELRQALLNGDFESHDMERGFTRHPIEPGSEGIIVQLGMQCILNHIKLLLWDKDQRGYSYVVEVSMDRKDWVRVADYSKYICRSWQRIYFPAKVVRYIRVLGKHNTSNRVFHLVHLEALYTTQSCPLDPLTGLMVPTENIASERLGACVLEGVSRTRNALLNGDTQGYDWDTGYTCHQLNSGSILILLAQPFIIGSMKLLLWDCDDRYYSYYIEVSTDGNQWKRVIDKSSESCRSWQLIKFEPIPLSYIKIVGTHNTANEVFHCVHFECPAQACPMEICPSPSENSSPGVY